jgi:hypothetical protein
MVSSDVGYFSVDSSSKFTEGDFALGLTIPLLKRVVKVALLEMGFNQDCCLTL